MGVPPPGFCHALLLTAAQEDLQTIGILFKGFKVYSKAPIANKNSN